MPYAFLLAPSNLSLSLRLFLFLILFSSSFFLRRYRRFSPLL
ncbi:hypothetical protein GCWU000341_01795 [Oribacterium sp. oral taxon 078 str. F0262]|nr:hypothetical protein GCWU000341_01795 [Oribacterium sp. oral taxon 078 str. F0262]